MKLIERSFGCDECEARPCYQVEIGEDGPYPFAYAWLCADCIKKMYELLGEAEG